MEESDKREQEERINEEEEEVEEEEEEEEDDVTYLYGKASENQKHLREANWQNNPNYNAPKISHQPHIASLNPQCNMPSQDVLEARRASLLDKSNGLFCNAL